MIMKEGFFFQPGSGPDTKEDFAFPWDMETQNPKGTIEKKEAHLNDRQWKLIFIESQSILHSRRHWEEKPGKIPDDDVE